MKEAKLQVMNQVEDWNAVYADGWEFVCYQQNGYSVFQREKVAKPVSAPVPKKPAKKKR